MKFSSLCLDTCQKMRDSLGGGWRDAPMDDDYPRITNGEVYIFCMLGGPSGYCAAYEGTNFEHESWDGRSPREALRRLLNSYKGRVARMKSYRNDLDRDIPAAEAKYARMASWLNRTK